MDKEELIVWIRKNGEVSFSRSGGPGGQNVNKVNSKVTLKLRLSGLESLSPPRLALLQRRLSNRINESGELVIQASESRSQADNRRSAESRAANLIYSALKPEKKRKPTSPGKAAREKRLKAKKIRSSRKKLRKTPGTDS